MGLQIFAQERQTDNFGKSVAIRCCFGATHFRFVVIFRQKYEFVKSVYEHTAMRSLFGDVFRIRQKTDFIGIMT